MFQAMERCKRAKGSKTRDWRPTRTCITGPISNPRCGLFQLPLVLDEELDDELVTSEELVGELVAGELLSRSDRHRSGHRCGRQRARPGGHGGHSGLLIGGHVLLIGTDQGLGGGIVELDADRARRDGAQLDDQASACSGASSPTPRTSCAPRSPACARTSRSSSAPTGACRRRSHRRLDRRRGRAAQELSALIDDLIELGARGRAASTQREEVRFDILVTEAVERARRHALATFASRSTSNRTLVNGVPSRLDRAVNNLLDNAVKFAGDEGADRGPAARRRTRDPPARAGNRRGGHAAHVFPGAGFAAAPLERATG